MNRTGGRPDAQRVMVGRTGSAFNRESPPISGAKLVKVLSGSECWVAQVDSLDQLTDLLLAVPGRKAHMTVWDWSGPPPNGGMYLVLTLEEPAPVRNLVCAQTPTAREVMDVQHGAFVGMFIAMLNLWTLLTARWR